MRACEILTRDYIVASYIEESPEHGIIRVICCVENNRIDWWPVHETRLLFQARWPGKIDLGDLHRLDIKKSIRPSSV